jgi:hypothetical protein
MFSLDLSGVRVQVCTNSAFYVYSVALFGTTSSATSSYPKLPFTANVPPQFSQQFQLQFPLNFNPYGMPPYQPYGTLYEFNFKFSPGAVFGRGAASEGV